MDVVKLAQIIVRRWLIVVPVLLLGLGATYMAVSQIPPDYSSAFSLLVVNQNPDAPEVTAPVLVASMQNEASISGVKIGADESYGVTVGNDDIIRVTATAGSRAAAARLANDIVDQLKPTLDRRRSELDLTGDGPTLQILSRAAQASTTQAENKYQAVSTARLVPLARGGGVSGLSKLLAAAMAGGQTAVEVQASGGSASYQVTASKDLPLVTATIKGQSPRAVTSTATALTSSAKRRLAELLVLADQPSSAATVKPLGPPAPPQKDSKGIFRALVALLALTAALALVAAMAVESFSEHREKLRRSTARANVRSVSSSDSKDSEDADAGPPATPTSRLLARGVHAAGQDR